MGQGHAGPQRTRNISTEQLSHELASRFAKRCFTPIELYSFQDVFRSLADVQSNVHYWSEDTLCRYLEIPDALQVGPVLYRSATYLGAFPFPSLAPSILSFEALLKVVVIMTERYNRVLKKGNADRVRLLFRSLAVFDNAMSDEVKDTEQLKEVSPEGEEIDVKDVTHGMQSFAIDDPTNDDDEDEDDDELALAALESLDAIEVFKHGEKSNLHQAQIPADNFRQLLMLLLVVAALQPQESLAAYAHRFKDDQLSRLRTTADNILWAFGVEKHAGVLYHDYNIIVSNSLPYLFDGLNPLFEHFLFSKNVDFSKSTSSENPAPSLAKSAQVISEPLLLREGDILDSNILSQLSFFIKGSNLFRRLRPLYIGSDAGFSLGSFETKVLKWRAPTILLVAGTRLPSTPSNSRERAFADTIPSHRYPGDGGKGNQKDDRVIFGAYIPTPWKITSKDPFGDPSTLLFQLSPIHEVFRASEVNQNYVSLLKSPSLPHSGIAIGSPIPSSTKTSNANPPPLDLGPVSLTLNDSLEFGVFTHDIGGGGSFHASQTRKFSFQERFGIDALEVWGCGGDEEAKRQREAWAFEEREARLRRQVNLGKDIEADRALLEMAGLVGQHRSGGSI
ncbi:MAG: Restriction of telomere capping protein 5 [Peltula sp. TS41687]|nr:MAG: Restriction of telomere capping protein 5 [Peltula sp. TS41687]